MAEKAMKYLHNLREDNCKLVESLEIQSHWDCVFDEDYAVSICEPLLPLLSDNHKILQIVQIDNCVVW